MCNSSFQSCLTPPSKSGTICFMAEQSRKRVVALIRVSTLKQIKDKEADYQRNQVRQTCSIKNLELVKEFPLENISGLVVRHTDQFRALKKAIVKRDIDGLVLPSMDRLCRTTEFQSVAAARAGGVPAHVVRDLHQRAGERAERTGGERERVVRRERLELVRRRDERMARHFRDAPRDR